MKAEEKVYHDLLDHVLHLLEHKLSVEMVAASLMAIAQRLYKTHLSEKSYHTLMDIIHDTDVEPYNVKKERLH